MNYKFLFAFVLIFFFVLNIGFQLAKWLIDNVKNLKTYLRNISYVVISMLVLFDVYVEFGIQLVGIILVTCPLIIFTVNMYCSAFPPKVKPEKEINCSENIKEDSVYNRVIFTALMSIIFALGMIIVCVSVF